MCQLLSINSLYYQLKYYLFCPAQSLQTHRHYNRTLPLVQVINDLIKGLCQFGDLSHTVSEVTLCLFSALTIYQSDL